MGARLARARVLKHGRAQERARADARARLARARVLKPPTRKNSSKRQACPPRAGTCVETRVMSLQLEVEKGARLARARVLKLKTRLIDQASAMCPPRAGTCVETGL